MDNNEDDLREEDTRPSWVILRELEIKKEMETLRTLHNFEDTIKEIRDILKITKEKNNE